jgi:hypothetical protein
MDGLLRDEQSEGAMHRPMWTPRRWIGVAAVAVAAALTPIAVLSATAAPARAVTTASTPACTTSGLVVWLNTRGSGAAGSIYYQLEFTNLSGHTCTLRGYPGVSAVNLTGHQLGRAASRSPIYPLHTVTLLNHATASVLLRTVQVSLFPLATCHPTTAAGLRVYPPNRTTAKMVPYPFGACARTGPIYLSVAVVR